MDAKRVGRVLGVAGLLGAVLLAGILAAPAETPVQKLRIKVDGKANGSGYIKLAVTPTGAGTQIVEVPVADRDHKDVIAAAMAKALAVALGDAFKVDTKGGDKVEVRGKEKKNTLTLTVSELSVRGVSVTLD